MGHRRCRESVFGLVLPALLFAFAGCGPSESPVQAPQRPHKFEILAPVQAAASDWSSKAFHRDYLPDMIQLGAERFNQANIAARFSELALDPEQLVIAEGSPVRIYFVGENAGLQNTLGISLDPPGESRANPRLIFPNATTNTNLVEVAKRIKAAGGTIDESVHGPPTAEAPVVPGDFVDLGYVEAGTTLNFFLVSDGGRHGRKIYWPDPKANEDGVQHMVAIATAESPYMIVSFEDMFGGGDKDYSDCVFAVSLSNYNVEALLGKIDPWRRVKQTAKLGALIALFVGGPIAAIHYWRKRRKRKIREQIRRATDLLEAENPAEALAIIRKEKKRVWDNATVTWLQALELTACEDLMDVESLGALYDESPGAFESNESAALWAAKAALENEQQETLIDITGLWKQRPEASGAWVCLQADALTRHDERQQALELLEARPLDEAHEGGRLARLATLRTETAPDEARDHMQQALDRAPKDPEVHLHGGRMLERAGKLAEAAKHAEYAVHLAPRDPFVRDRAGDFFQRRGDYMRAIQIWSDGLNPPSTGFLWLKTLFWCKVAHPVPIDFAGKARPDGPLRPLIDLLITLSPQRLWDEHAFGPIAERVPQLANRQEVYWLRLLENMRCGEDDQALALLNLSPFGHDAWHPQLERALLQIVTFRKYGFLKSQPVANAATGSERPHPFFQELDHWANGGTPDPAFDRLLRSEDAASAACLAAGWYEAGLRLQHCAKTLGQFPPWYDHSLEVAHHHNGTKPLTTMLKRTPGPAPVPKD